jgi:hypothetical protein
VTSGQPSNTTEQKPTPTNSSSSQDINKQDNEASKGHITFKVYPLQAD